MGRLLQSKIATVFLGAAFLGLLYSFTKLQIRSGSTEEKINDLESKISSVEEGNKYLEKFLNSVENPDFLEREARIRLNYKNADEEVVFVYRDLNKGASVSGDPISLLPNYKKWWYYLLGK